MTTDPLVRRVLIVGGGTAGWMTAAALSKLIGRHLNITLVESDAIGTIGVGEATIPTFIALHQLLKISEAEFLSRVQGTIKLGISFERWQNLEKNYIHAFGTTGQGCWAAGFITFGIALNDKVSLRITAGTRLSSWQRNRTNLVTSRKRLSITRTTWTPRPTRNSYALLQKVTG